MYNSDLTTYRSTRVVWQFMGIARDLIFKYRIFAHLVVRTVSRSF